MQNLPLHIYSAFQSAKNPEILLQGFQKYLQSNYPTNYAAHDIFAECHHIRLRHYKSDNPSNSLFLIPSLINGPEIFDLTKDVSFIRFLLDRNIDVYLIDWGDLSSDFDGGLDDLINSLQTLWQSVCSRSNLPVHALGYCLGGSIAAAFFGNSDSISQPASLTFLATPFDFKVKEASWRYVLNNPSQIKAQINLHGALSQRMLQSHFINLKPDFIIQKFEDFLDMEHGSMEEERFIAVEKWLNEGPDLPLQLSLDLIDKFFIENAALQDVQKIEDIPVIIISSREDQIVPFQASNISEDFGRHCHQIINDCGHVGMMVGRGAKKAVWRPFTEHITTIATQQT